MALIKLNKLIIKLLKYKSLIGWQADKIKGLPGTILLFIIKPN